MGYNSRKVFENGVCELSVKYWVVFVLFCFFLVSWKENPDTAFHSLCFERFRIEFVRGVIVDACDKTVRLMMA